MRCSPALTRYRALATTAKRRNLLPRRPPSWLAAKNLPTGATAGYPDPPRVRSYRDKHRLTGQTDSPRRDLTCQDRFFFFG